MPTPSEKVSDAVLKAFIEDAERERFRYLKSFATTPDIAIALARELQEWRTGIPGEGNSSLRIGSPSPVPSNWRPIAELRRDLEWIMHFNGPGQINPAWLQIRMQKTLALLPSPPAAEDAQPSTERGEATPSPPV
jgi:hypothetical protein